MRIVPMTKEEGIELALSVHKEWQARFEEAALELARKPYTFTSEDVTDIVGLPTGEAGLHKNMAVGGMMHKLGASKRIVNTKRVTNTKSNHSSRTGLWIGAEHVDEVCSKCGR
jgi:hypothetical protein